MTNLEKRFLPYCDHEYANREDNAANCAEEAIDIAVLFAEWVLRQDITSRGIGLYVNYVGEIITTKDLFKQYYDSTFGDSNEAGI